MIRLELGDIAYDSKTFDFYLDDVAEFFGLKSKSEIEKKSKTIKYYCSIKVIMRFDRGWAAYIVANRAENALKLIDDGYHWDKTYDLCKIYNNWSRSAFFKSYS